MQVVGDTRWLDDRIAALKADIDYLHSEIKDHKDEIIALQQRREKLMQLPEYLNVPL